MDTLLVIGFVAVIAAVGYVYFTYFDKTAQKEK